MNWSCGSILNLQQFNNSMEQFDRELIGDKMTEDNSIDKQASGTAMATAFMRALAACDPRKEIRGNDRLAEIFLDEEQKKALKDPAVRAWLMQNKLTPGAYEFMLARTEFFDQVVEHALKENVAQIVLLGAGYDSRPYRFDEFIQDTRIFELDTKPTQQRKKDCLQQAQIPVSEHISFVPMNFETNNLLDKLIKAGFSREKKTLFVWEGVTYYLSAEVVDHMLTFVRTNSPPGSSICFDYAALSDKALNEDGAKELRKLMQSQHSNEPTKFGIHAGEIGSFLAERGFEIIEHLTAAEMNEKYLARGDHSDVGKVPSLFCLVHAKVK
jgi:methyltransferase (TIGR00027 family)